jgi:sugar lactone lactonase YvrE
MADNFALDLQRLRWVGRDLMRPECVLATAGGDLYCADWRGGVVHIDAAGGQRTYGGGAEVSADYMPNGIALLRDGSFLVANLGHLGGVWRQWRDGRREPWLMDVDGHALPPVNFVWLDAQERVWLTVMFKHAPEGGHTFQNRTPAGVLVRVDNVDAPASARVAREDLFTPNECRISLDGRSMFVNETFVSRVVRYDLAPDGTVGAREVLAQFDELTLPDGLSLDSEGALWVTAVGTNRILRVLPDGRWQQLCEDYQPDHMQAVRQAVADGTLSRPLLYANPGATLPNVTSIAFGGADLRTAYVGSVSGSAIAVFNTPVAGAAPVHWQW